MSARAMDEESIFCEALECPSAEAQAAYLAGACRGDGELRRRVEALLRVRSAHASFLAQPAACDCIPPQNLPRSALDGSGTVIGPYKLLERIGEGGFGVVYVAEQSQPVQRRVALKIIKAGMDTRQVIARFEAERQALAMMDHPNIARVLDAGATEAQSPLGPGRPYVVMELVRGVPITRFCDDQRLTLRERLALFVDACLAVQHAHQKGVIHRDLKPSNVLVSRYDDKPVVKIIDFGIAKATGGRLTDKTLFTEFRQMIGTPAYMSPEQAGLSDLDVDTRSDVYSLGVLLYELLTGTMPFEPDRLRSAAFDELRRIIREEEPPRPSTRVSRLLSRTDTPPGVPTPADARAGAPDADRGSSAAVIADARRADPRSLARSLDGEPDWIVMKCLEKDRSRRYQTANDLALDIGCFLSAEPVVAAPPSPTYRLRKFIRRHRLGVAAGAAVGAALVLGMAGTTAGLVWALREQGRAEQRRAEAEAAGVREREQRELAQTREKETRQVSDFQAAMLSEIDVEAMGRGIKDRFREQVRAALESSYVGEPPDRRLRKPEEVEAELAAFDQRAGAAQAVDVARRVMDEFVLARAADAVERQFADQPLVRAQLHVAIGGAYQKLGLYDDADLHLRAALETRQGHYGRERAHARVAECLYNLAGLMLDRARPSEAEVLYRDALAMWRELAEEEMVPKTLDALGQSIMRQRRWAEAEPLLNEALRLNRELYGEDHPNVMGTLATLAGLRDAQGRLAEAEALLREVLQKRRDLHGDRHPQVAHVLSNLAQGLRAQGRHAEAEELFREALAIRRAVYGDEHPLVAKALFNLGAQLADLGQRREAETCFRQALAQQRMMLGDHLEVRTTLGSLAQLRQQEADHDEAAALLRESLAIAERMYPHGHPEAWRRFSAIGKLGVALAAQAKAVLPTDRERALALFQEADTLCSTAFHGMAADPHSGSVEDKRRSLESSVKVCEFWHTVAPDMGWDKRAAAWRAELERLSGP